MNLINSVGVVNYMKPQGVDVCSNILCTFTLQGEAERTL